MGNNTILSNKFKSDLHILLRSFFQKIEVDRAVLYAILARTWGIAAGPVTALLIATQFSPEIQGYHYTFASILAFHSAVDLGFGFVVQQFASHEWSELNLNKIGQIIGDDNALSRLVSIANISMKWYLRASMIVTFILVLGGYLFFSYSAEIGIRWEIPWVILCILTGINFYLFPIWALLEGCNQVKKIYPFRFFQGAIVSISIWVAILLGANLWTASISTAAGLICSIVFLRKQYWSFFKTLLCSTPSGPIINWRIDMLPMQWRFAVSVFSGLFMTSIFTPLMFKYHGPIIAGQMGMTLSLISFMGLASAWLYPKSPQFGILVAKKKYFELDHLFWKLMKIVFALSVLLGLSIYVFVLVLHNLHVPLANRILSPLPTGLFLIAQCFVMFSMPCSMYMRAHKKEPIMFLNVFGSILTILFVWQLGKNYSALGMAAGNLLVTLIIIPSIFLIWYRYKNKWQRETL